MERAFFVAVGLLALWVGLWGFFVPREVGKALPFLVPPLHARFLGAMYLSGLTVMVGATVARSWAEARVAPPIIAIWTGGLLVVSLFHLDAFDLTSSQAEVWFAAYVAYPLVALSVIWRHRGADAHQRAPGTPLALWPVGYLVAQGVAATAVGVALLAAPGAMTDVWPWPITGLLAQLYGAPLLAYGVVSLILSRQQTWPEIRIGVVGMFVFAVGVLVASLIHRDLFSTTDFSAWVWFGALAVAAVALGGLGAIAVAASASRSKA